MSQEMITTEAPATSRYLLERLRRNLLCSQKKRQAHHSLVSARRCLHGGAIPQNAHDGCDAVFDEVNVFDRSLYVIQKLPLRKVDQFGLLENRIPPGRRQAAQ